MKTQSATLDMEKNIAFAERKFTKTTPITDAMAAVNAMAAMNTTSTMDAIDSKAATVQAHAQAPFSLTQQIQTTEPYSQDVATCSKDTTYCTTSKDVSDLITQLNELQKYEVSFALYRLPRQKDLHLILSPSCRCFKQWEELTAYSGFVFAPFDLSKNQSLVLIEPQLHAVGIKDAAQTIIKFLENSEQLPYAVQQNLPDWALASIESQRKSYHESFSKLHQALFQGECSKLVLSRAAAYQCDLSIDLGVCFLKACTLYPNLMISLTHTPITGTWLGSTPEILLSGCQVFASANHSSHNSHSSLSPANRSDELNDGLTNISALANTVIQPQTVVQESIWQTMSLAGTMSLAEVQSSTNANRLKSTQAQDVSIDTESGTVKTVRGSVNTESKAVKTESGIVKTEGGVVQSPTLQQEPSLPDLSVWSAKNRHEQAIVTQFLADTLIPWCKELYFKGPYTAQAGNLIHLRTDAVFKLQNDFDLTKVIKQLHPTPAVCGMPRARAYDLIRTLEHYDRGYYAGALGLFGLDQSFVQDQNTCNATSQERALNTKASLKAGVNEDKAQLQPQDESLQLPKEQKAAPAPESRFTQLFVNLRCMQFYSNHQAICYAGGGILTASDEISEFQETQRKMETMRSLLEPPFEL